MLENEIIELIQCHTSLEESWRIISNTHQKLIKLYTNEVYVNILHKNDAINLDDLRFLSENLLSFNKTICKKIGKKLNTF